MIYLKMLTRHLLQNPTVTLFDLFIFTKRIEHSRTFFLISFHIENIKSTKKQNFTCEKTKKPPLFERPCAFRKISQLNNVFSYSGSPVYYEAVRTKLKFRKFTYKKISKIQFI